MKRYIYVLHEYGAPSHYNGLTYLAKLHNYEILFYEFKLLTLFKKVVKGNFPMKKWIADLGFLFMLPFIKPSKIVLGIAPFNASLPILMILLKRHEVYYHTSYTHWDGVTIGYPTKSKFVKNKWKQFTNKYVRHIFAVSQKTKEELILNNYSTAEQISIVNHSYNITLSAQNKDTKENSFIFVGRITPQKGIKELLKLFSACPQAKLTIVGDGPDVDLVKDYSTRYKNIEYKGYIKCIQDLIPLYQSSSFIVMNSQRLDGWEELFGISLIEGMSCGCVPITTDHSGPKEIITNKVNGIICKEGDIAKGIEQAINMKNEEYLSMRYNSIKRGNDYTIEKIALKWNEILS